MRRLNRRRSSCKRPPESRLVLLQTTMAAYRDGFVRELIARAPDVNIWAGQEYFDPTTRLSAYISVRSQRLGNCFLLKRRLLWQVGAFRAASHAQSVVLEFNPRILSNWPLLAYRKLRGRWSVLWGHAWPRRGQRSKRVFLRRWMLLLADAGLVYTERDQQQLSRFTRRPIFLAANAIVSRRVSLPSRTRPANVLQVGRLVPGKKPALTLEAWFEVHSRLPSHARLIFVGDGPLRPELESMSHRPGFERVVFAGEITDRITLAELYGGALVSVSAGYAGLSVTESLSHGVPIVIADDEPHSPEIALASQENSRFFTANEPSALADCLVSIFGNQEGWIAKRAEIAAAALATYSIEAMAQGFLAAAKYA
jgi:glycosyltransferase involved in cell wall biosynthesis